MNRVLFFQKKKKKMQKLGNVKNFDNQNIFSRFVRLGMFKKELYQLLIGFARVFFQ